MLNRRFIQRQLTATRQQSGIFVLCVALSMISLVALRGFGQSIDQALAQDARALQAADIIVQSNFALSQPTEALIQDLAETGVAQSARVWEFLTVARLAQGEATLLSEVKAVEPGYPFYGEVTLASGRTFAQALQPGQILVGQDLLDRLGIGVGDGLILGQLAVTIGDVVLAEPDRPLDFFSLGPRIFLAAGDLPGTELVQAGSRVTYRTLLRVADENQVDRVANQLRSVREQGQESVETFRTTPSGVRSFFDNLVFFLSLVAIFTLLLSGIGIQSALTAFLRERYTTIAIIKTLGATQRVVSVNFYAVVGMLGLLGMGLGLAGGLILQQILPGLLGDLLPPDVSLTISPRSVAEGLILGVFVLAAFTFVPLYQLGELRPNFIFRKESMGLSRPWIYLLAGGIILAGFAGMVFWLLGDLTVTGYFVATMLGLLLITALLTEGTLRLLRRMRLASLTARQALAGLFRPRNPTRAIIITLSASLGVLFCLFLVEQSLNASFVASYPEDAPNVFFLDIQPDQREAFRAALGEETPFFPVIRGTVELVNGEPPRRRADAPSAGEPDEPVEDRDRRDFPFNLTYRDDLLESEGIVAGPGLFDPDFAGNQVSALDDVMDFARISLGDRVTFRVQGVPVEATVTSIRTQRGEGVEPFFSFVFPSAVLGSAPQTIFTGLRMDDPAAIPPLQNRIAGQFPNVSVINVAATIETFSGIAQRITNVIRFFTIFSIAAGLLIVVSAVFATRFARIQEAAYYKVLGAKSSFVLRVFTLENLFLGLVSGLLALGMAQVGSWLITRQLLNLEYRPFYLASGLMLLMTMLLVTAVGMAASAPILSTRPIYFLREQGGEE